MLRLNLLLNILSIYSIIVASFLFIDNKCQLPLVIPYHIYLIIDIVTNILALSLVTIYCYKYKNFNDMSKTDTKIIISISTIILLLSCLLIYGGRIQIYPSPYCQLEVIFVTSIWIINIISIVYIAFIVMIYIELAMQTGHYSIPYYVNN